MARNIVETIMGAVVLAVAIGFFVFAYQKSSVNQVDGYLVNADFSDVTGIGVGSDVRLGGMKVGVVQDLSLNSDTFIANVVMEMQDDIRLPTDSSATISSSGLLGDKYVKIQPGGSDDTLNEGDAIKFTQSSISIEEMIGKFVFSGGGVDSNKEDAKDVEDEVEEDNNPFSLGL